MANRRQGIFWILTIPHESFTPYPVPNCTWLRGQLECGETTGYLHWQLIVAFASKKSLSGVQACFGQSCHAELSRSEAADSYVWKELTAIPGTQFEFGSKPIRRNSKPDWDSIWDAATSGNLSVIPASIRVSSYRSLRTIASDYAKVVGMERTCFVFWGRTGTGKSRRAWDEAGLDSYPKDPRTKFWDGYQSEENVIIDEFRGGIDVSHLLRWLDRYPVRVEIKGSSRPLAAKTIWITSNLDPRRWYPEIDQETLDALLRRLNITHFN
jgi:hypothetical protein